MHFRVLKKIATSGFLTALPECTKFVSTTHPAGRAYSALPDFLAALRGEGMAPPNANSWIRPSWFHSNHPSLVHSSHNTFVSTNLFHRSPLFLHHNRLKHWRHHCSRTRILRLFAYFSKTWLFTFYWNNVSKTCKRLVLNPSKWVHILRSVLTVIHLSYLPVSLVYLRTYRNLSHTVLSCIVSCECGHCVRIPEQRF